MSWPYRSGRLERPGNEPVQGNAEAFAARMSDGSVQCWGEKKGGGDCSSVEGLENVKAICSAWSGAFAAIVGEDNSVICWGNRERGGDCSEVAGDLKEVEGICASSAAFAALRRNGTVVTWGRQSAGGDSSSVCRSLKGVKAIYSTFLAFAAVLHDGTVEAWGEERFGGSIPPSVKERLKQVETISANFGAFAALLCDGTVQTWGDPEYGGDSSKVASQLTQVVLICGSHSAFAALREDGTVVVWGNQYGGADASQVKERLTQVVGIASTEQAFAAVRSDGEVVTWGVPAHGGDSSKVAQELKDVVAVRGTTRAFAALQSNGNVIVWGHKDGGADRGYVISALKNVVAISSSHGAFAARRSDGTIVTWGLREYGGNIDRIYALKQPGATEGKVVPREPFSRRHQEKEAREEAAKREKALRLQAERAEKERLKKAEEEALQEKKRAEAQRREEEQRQREEEQRQREEAERQKWEDYIKERHRAVEARLMKQAQSEAAEKRNEEERQALQEKKRQEALKEKERQALKEKERLREEALNEERLREEALKEKERLREETLKEREKVSRLEAAMAEKERLALERQRELEQERSRWEQEREALVREKGQAALAPPLGKAGPGVSAETPKSAPEDGTAEFWALQLQGVLEEGDIVEAASKLSAAGFRKRHVGDISRDDLKDAGFKQVAVIKDFMKNQHLLGSKAGGNASPNEQKLPQTDAAQRPMFATSLKQLPRIPEEELTMEKEVGQGAFSVVWKATWRRKIAVGKQRVQVIEVAVKMSNRSLSGNNTPMAAALSDELTRDLAVISGLPHQNILTLHGVCESDNKGGGYGPKVVFELMSTDLATMLKQALDQFHKSSHGHSRSPLLAAGVLLRVLRDISAGLAHLHANGVVHRDVKPANVLLRDEQVKLCDFGSSKDLQHTIQQMTVTGTLDYMAPEVLDREPAGRAADVWSFGVLLFQCVTGKVCARKATMEELKQELMQWCCLPALVALFVECHQAEANKRPSMHSIHLRLQRLVMQEASDSQRLKEELKRAEAQDRDTYEVTWNDHYGNQLQSINLLEYIKQRALLQQGAVKQPLKQQEGKGNMEELEQLARVGGRLHERLKAIVEECGGTYLWAPRKSYERCVQKVNQEYGGDYSKLLDLERATGLFDQAGDMLRCLQRVNEECSSAAFSSSSSSEVSLRVLRCKDRMNKPLDSGYRDILMNVCDEQSGFVAELQLNFHKIAQIKSQSHRFYELIRVMELQWA